MRTMRIIKRINHNAVVCRDGKGRDVVALGRGIGFPDQGDDVEVSRINRTYYNLDDRYLALFDEIPLDVLDCAAQIVDLIRGAIPYELSPSFPLTLADHIAFMLKRAREHLTVGLPFSYDMAHLHPLEYRMGVFTVERVERAFDVRLNDREAAGVALSILMAAMPDDSAGHETDSEALLDDVTRDIEEELGIRVDRRGAAYARFATHVLYLIKARDASDASGDHEDGLLEILERDNQQIVRCASRVAQRLGRELDHELADGERVYLTLHIHRLHAAALASGASEPGPGASGATGR